VCDVWSGPEFEERIRAHCESLLKRFVLGVEFPDTPNELKVFVKTPDTGFGLENRTAIYQELYSLWREFKNGLWFADLRNAAEVRIRDWLDHKGLYLDKKVREELRSCLNEVARFQGWKDRNEKEAADYQLRVIQISKNIEHAADLLK